MVFVWCERMGDANFKGKFIQGDILMKELSQSEMQQVLGGTGAGRPGSGTPPPENDD